MEKINFIRVIFWYTVVCWLIFLGITILIERPENYNIGFRDSGRIIQGALYCFVSIVCFMMEILLYRLNKTRQKEVIIQLMGYFGLSAIGILFQGLFGIIEFKVRVFQTFWTDSTFFFIIAAGFCLGCFVIEVFKKGIEAGENTKKIILFLIASMVSIIVLFLMQITEIDLFLILIPFMVYISIFLTSFISLIFNSFALRKRMESPIEKKAFLLIGLHGILLISVGFFAVLYSITDFFLLRYFAAVLASVAYFSLYKGITLPMKKES